jgi:hypothetical protein
MHEAISPLPQYIFMVWCFVKQRDNFTFYLLLSSISPIHTPTHHIIPSLPFHFYLTTYTNLSHSCTFPTLLPVIYSIQSCSIPHTPSHYTTSLPPYPSKPIPFLLPFTLSHYITFLLYNPIPSFHFFATILKIPDCPIPSHPIPATTSLSYKSITFLLVL